MAMNPEIVAKLKLTKLENAVNFVYDNWLGFTVPKKEDGKLGVATGYKNIQTGQRVRYDNSYAPIAHTAYAMAYDALIKPFKQAKSKSQLNLFGE